jgi:protocatechuate 3,4-dioxygenase beta subunit
MSKDIHITRRQALAGMGAAGAGLIAARFGGIPGLGSGEAAQAAACVLTPEQTEGPYYVDLNKVRRNITEGRPGVPLRLRVYILDSATCKPIQNAAVDIWHCDALGVYSDESVESTSGQTWMRGVQLTNSSGLATFTTIYPGHYVGRTTHIHLKAHVKGHVAHTGQLFFTDRLSREVYRLSPYKKDTSGYQTRGSDQVYADQHGASAVMKVKRRGSSLRRSGLIGTITLGVDPSATPSPV